MKFCASVPAAVACAASLFAEEAPESMAKSGLPVLLTIYKDVPVMRKIAGACLLLE